MRMRVGRWACAVGVILDQRGGVDICGLVGLLKMRVSEIFDGQNRNVGPRGGGRSRTPPHPFWVERGGGWSTASCLSGGYLLQNLASVGVGIDTENTPDWSGQNALVGGLGRGGVARGVRPAAPLGVRPAGDGARGARGSGLRVGGPETGPKR